MPASDNLSSKKIEYAIRRLEICVVLKKTQNMKAIPKSEFSGSYPKNSRLLMFFIIPVV